jgi:iron complex outermembrane receptor protein
MVDSRHTVWAAVSRATRTPSRRDTDALITIVAYPGDNGVTQEAVVYGNPNQKSEHVIANEIGYRAQATPRLSFDIAAFVNYYDQLRTRESGAPFHTFTPDGSDAWINPIVWGNLMHGITQGVEVSADWRVSNRWRLSPGYTLLQMHLHTASSSTDVTSVSGTEGASPRHQAQLRSSFDLRRWLTWDASFYYVDALPAQDIPAYKRLDSQLRWRLGEQFELDIAGQNLLRDHHPESNDMVTVVNPSLVKRGAYAQVRWRF